MLDPKSVILCCHSARLRYILGLVSGLFGVGLGFTQGWFKVYLGSV